MACLALLVVPAAAPAHGGPKMQAAAETRPSILKDVGIDQKLGVQVPADLVFTNHVLMGGPVGARIALGAGWALLLAALAAAAYGIFTRV